MDEFTERPREMTDDRVRQLWFVTTRQDTDEPVSFHCQGPARQPKGTL